jgi:hypothetical protein
MCIALMQRSGIRFEKKNLPFIGQTDSQNWLITSCQPHIVGGDIESVNLSIPLHF